MTLLEHLQTHKGGLIRLKTELYWYDGRGYDGSPGRICLILDAARYGTAATAAEAAAEAAAARAGQVSVVALLLIDGSPHWVWVAEADVELI